MREKLPDLKLGQSSDKKYIHALLALTAGLGILFFSFLGSRPFSSPSEARYVEIPREMAQTKDYVTPRLNGLIYFEKPPLVYWLETIPFKAGLTSEYALRAPIALMALLGCLMVFAFSAHLYSLRTGVWSSIVLGTSFLYFGLARFILLDLVFGVFMAGTLLSFIVGYKEKLARPRRLFFALASSFMALAVLTKGLIGLVLPLGIIGGWVLLLGSWRNLRPLFLPTNILLFLLIAAPWHILVSLKNPGFFNFYFVHEHFQRYLTPIHRRHQPFWFFFPIVFIGFLPWSPFLARAFWDFLPRKWKEIKAMDVETFLVLWALFPLLFFSFSSSKLVPYIVPIFPALSIIVGRFIAYKARNNLSLFPEFLAYAVLSLMLGSAGYLYLGSIKSTDPALWTLVAPTAQKFLILGGVPALLCPLLCLFLRQKTVLMTFIASQLALLFFLNHWAPRVQKTSLKPVAQAILQGYGPTAKVVSYRFYLQDLSVYWGRPVQIFGWRGELDLGASAEPRNKIMLTEKQLEKQWSQGQASCIVAKRSFCPELQRRFSKGKAHWLLLNESYGVLCNRPPLKPIRKFP